jgi:anti-sigma regulatory factor (Ser/Thr protein kinase)
MTLKRVKLVIDSDLEQVSLIGITINKLCSLTLLSETEFNQIELCVVEAVNNSIEHAYGNEKGSEVEVTFTLHADKLVVDVCDTGKPMEKGLMEQRDISLLEIDPDDLDNIAEEGRGIPIMKKIMDTVTYGTEDGKNCLTLIKSL